MCVVEIQTRKNEAKVQSFISCTFILQSLMGFLHFPDYEYLKVYIHFFGLFLFLPSCYMKIPLQTYLWGIQSCKDHFMTPKITLTHCQPSAEVAPVPAGAGHALAPPRFCVSLWFMGKDGGDHRITKSFGLEGTFRGHLAQPPCSEQGHLPLDQVAQSSVQPDLECFQGWDLHYFSGQPMPVSHHPRGEK